MTDQQQQRARETRECSKADSCGGFRYVASGLKSLTDMLCGCTWHWYTLSAEAQGLHLVPASWVISTWHKLIDGSRMQFALQSGVLQAACQTLRDKPDATCITMNCEV